jgi:hypothetical protein
VVEEELAALEALMPKLGMSPREPKMMLTLREHVLHGENAGMSSQNGDISAEACQWHVFEAEYKALSLSKRSLYSRGLCPNPASHAAQAPQRRFAAL